MRRNASLRKQDADVPATATPEAAAGQAGRSIDQWIAAALAEQAARATPADTALAEGTAEDGKGRRGGRGRGAGERDELDSLLAAAAASERRAIETANKTAMALGSVASWIERAQERLTETTAAASKSQQVTAAVVSDAVGAIGQRLEAIERKVEQGGADAVGEALRAIERLESRLAAEPPRPAPAERTASDEGLHVAPAPATAPAEQPQERPVEDSPAFEEALRGFEARIAELSQRVATAPKPIARRALSRPDEIQGAVAEIRSRQAALADVARSDRAPDPVLGEGGVQSDVLTSLQADLSRLTGQLETIRPAVSAAPEMLRGEIEALRRSLEGVATREDLGRLADSMQALSAEIAQARDSGGSAVGAALEIEALQAEIRALQAARLPVEETRLHRDIDILTHKLDIAAASGIDPAVADTLTGQLGEIRDLVAGVATPAALAGLSDQLSSLKEEVAEVGQRQIATEEFSSLKVAVEDMRVSFAASQDAEGSAAWPALAPATTGAEGGTAIEGMLLSLMEKLDRVERKVTDPDALDHLEHQVQGLAARLGEMGGHDPALAALEGSMGELLREVSTWRDGAAEMADRAARVAIAETLGAMPQPAEIERQLHELMDQYEASEERTQGSLSGVHARLEDVVSRIALLEAEAASARSETSTAPVRPLADTVPQGRGEATSHRRPETETSPVAAPFPSKRPASALHEADRPIPPATSDEILIEPGAARPGGATSSGSEGTADGSDIKSSFIAAARRAAQAAATDASAGRALGGPRRGAASLGAASPTELLGRLRALISARRRPLLISAAAIVLVLGGLQASRLLTSAPAPAPAVTAGTETVAVPPPAPAETPDIAEAPAARTEPADPTTTQSIGTRGAAGGGQPLATGPAEPVRPFESATVSPPATPAPTAAASAAAPSGPAAPTVAAAIASRGPAAPETGPSLAGLKSAAAAGNVVATFELATRTAEGRGVPRDAKLAASLFEKAAEKGLAPAQYRTGNLYERGVGVARDVEAARAWYRRAAENGNIRAMHNLAVLIAEGGSAKPDYPTAIGWFQKAADHGVRDSQFNLAVLHARGLGLPQDLAKAYLWLAVAASGGDEDAGKKRDEVAAKLAPAELQRAKAAFDKWRPLPADPVANDVQVPAAGWPEAPIKRASR